MKRRQMLWGLPAAAVATWLSRGPWIDGIQGCADSARADCAPQTRSEGELVSMVGLGGYHVGVQSDPKESIRIIRTASRGRKTLRAVQTSRPFDGTEQNPEWLG